MRVEIVREEIVKCRASFKVEREHLASHLLEKGVKILSTPCLILFMEKTARSCLDHLLKGEKTSVGYRVDIRHRRSVNEGEIVIVEAKLSSFNGRKAVFTITAFNREGEVIGEAFHERYIVEK